MINRSFCTQVPPLFSTHHVERCGLNMMRWAGKASKKFQKTRLTQLELFLIYSALWLQKWCDVPRITSLMGSQRILMILNIPITSTGPIHWRPSEYEHPLNTDSEKPGKKKGSEKVCSEIFLSNVWLFVLNTHNITILGICNWIWWTTHKYPK